MDITTNTDYKDYETGAEVWGIAAAQVYSYKLEYNTLIDEKWSANEQRRAQWDAPRRTWTLDFKKTPAAGRKFEDFYKAVMGSFKAFKFKWSKYAEDGTDMGGDDNWYTVRFSSDTLSVNVNYMGYREFSIDIQELRNGA